MVRTNTLVVPGASDAAVMRLKEPRRPSRWPPTATAAGAQLESATGRDARRRRSRAQRGLLGRASHAATNCLNFGSPEKPEVMWQFSEAIDGIADACKRSKLPITGGNVSFYNETLGKLRSIRRR